MTKISWQINKINSHKNKYSSNTHLYTNFEEFTFLQLIFDRCSNFANCDSIFRLRPNWNHLIYKNWPTIPFLRKDESTNQSKFSDRNENFYEPLILKIESFKIIFSMKINKKLISAMLNIAILSIDKFSITSKSSNYPEKNSRFFPILVYR